MHAGLSSIKINLIISITFLLGNKTRGKNLGKEEEKGEEGEEEEEEEEEKEEEKEEEEHASKTIATFKPSIQNPCKAG